MSTFMFSLPPAEEPQRFDSAPLLSVFMVRDCPKQEDGFFVKTGKSAAAQIATLDGVLIENITKSGFKKSTPVSVCSTPNQIYRLPDPVPAATAA